MAARGVARKLTTILAADVVGYSRLMGADEAGSPAALEGPSQGTHRTEGRTVKLMGDGMPMALPLFDSPGLTSRRRHSGMAQRRISSHLP